VHVEEGQRRGFKEEVKFGRIQQGMEGHQHGPRRVLIERHARDDLHDQGVHGGHDLVALLG
jgi:hypothetical protein